MVKGEIIRKHLRDKLHQAYLRNEKSYNIRSREVKFILGQEVYRSNFRQSEFRKGCNAQLASKFLKCRVVKPVGNGVYEVEDLQGKALGIFHAKHLNQ